ncbi:uncharacterized protein LOC106129283 isoform X2 [Amyelois transitella]|uniref:uncharacterized protein LOC106129283 isoform X2 n=1 Tax=Amyelois transitella TaxID=680683 RepID=UPI00298F5A72|nr:uncharacterized protein LOC106129283 isoform X2 [Amyelois transitella]
MVIGKMYPNLSVSGVVTNGKPILRLRDDSSQHEDEAAIIPDDKNEDAKHDTVSSEVPLEDVDNPEAWVEDAQEAIARIQEDLGSKNAEPFIKKLINGKTKLSLEKIEEEELEQPIARAKKAKLWSNKREEDDHHAKPRNGYQT